MNRRNVILSVLALCWGLAVLVLHFINSSASPAAAGHSSAYGTGHTAGLVFAVLLVAAGARGLVFELRRRRAA